MSEYPQSDFAKDKEEPFTLMESLKVLQFKAENLFELRSSSQLLVDKLNRTVDLPLAEPNGPSRIPEAKKEANIVQLFNEVALLIETVSGDIQENILKASRMID